MAIFNSYVKLPEGKQYGLRWWGFLIANMFGQAMPWPPLNNHSGPVTDNCRSTSPEIVVHRFPKQMSLFHVTIVFSCVFSIPILFPVRSMFLVVFVHLVSLIWNVGEKMCCFLQGGTTWGFIHLYILILSIISPYINPYHNQNHLENNLSIMTISTLWPTRPCTQAIKRKPWRFWGAGDVVDSEVFYLGFAATPLKDGH